MNPAAYRRLTLTTLSVCLVATGCGREVDLGSAEGVADPTIVSLARGIDTARYEAHLAALPEDRLAGTPGHQDAQDLCADHLDQLGFDVELQAYDVAVNVIGTRPGESPARVVLAARYAGYGASPSHLAGLLEVAEVLSTGSHARTLVVACWGDGAGAEAFAEREFALEREIFAVIDLEGIAVYNAEPGSQEVPPDGDLLFPDEFAGVADDEFRGDFVLTSGNELSRTSRAAFGVYATAFGLDHIDLEIPDELQGSGFFLVSYLAGANRPFWSRGFPAMRVMDTAAIGARTAPAAPLHSNFAIGVMSATVGAAATELVLIDPI